MDLIFGLLLAFAPIILLVFLFFWIPKAMKKDEEKRVIRNEKLREKVRKGEL